MTELAEPEVLFPEDWLPRGANQLFGPPEWNGAHREYYVRSLNHSAVLRHHPNGAQYRRDLCEHDPLMFMLIYLDTTLRTRRLDGAIVLSRFHIDALAFGRRWVFPDYGPAECRDAWVAARKSGKSTIFQGLLLWALAFGHRRFALLLGHTKLQINRHMKSIRSQLRSNDKLRMDFPELCNPLTEGGRAVSDNIQEYRARCRRLGPDGKWRFYPIVLMAMGIEESALGLKAGSELPDLMMIDDGEGHESRYSLHQKMMRLRTLRDVVFHLNLDAVVAMIGSTTRHGSIMHDVVRGAEWSRRERIRPHIYSAIEIDPESGAWRSAWPAKWSMNYLLEHYGERGFALNMLCDPLAPGEGAYWYEELFVAPPAQIVAALDDRIISIDPTELVNGDANDFVGIARLASASAYRKAIVEQCVGLKPSADELRGRLHDMIRNGHRFGGPPIRRVLLEMNKGGRLVKQICSPLPSGVVWDEIWADEPKLSRLGRSADRFIRGDVYMAGTLATLRAQLLAVPNGDHDDEADAMAQGLDELLPEIV